ncbi:hypothetical protein AB1Y20_016124 [Prymnesium parvum]|uniref:Glycosyl transferase CAP10 domain-containing protein n=1 Tax=Prymnesium parvum TaxID=97485 RepID=A0AB34JYN2_PRYPA
MEGRECRSDVERVHCWLLLLLLLAAGLLLPRSVSLFEPAQVTLPASSVQLAKGTTPGGGDPHLPSSPSSPSPSSTPPLTGMSLRGTAARRLPVPQPAARCEPPPPRGGATRFDDWVFAADGTSAHSWAAQFRFLASGVADGMRGHLVNRLSSGCVNWRGGGEVRGHCNSEPQDRAAPPSASTELHWLEQPKGTPRVAACVAAERARFRFTLAAEAYLYAGEGGVLRAGACTAHRCDFELLAAPRAEERAEEEHEWFVLRSVATGRYVKLHHAEMPEDPSWNGIHHQEVALKRPRRTAGPSRDRLTAAALEEAARARGQCPLKRGQLAYNTSLWEPVVQRYLEPWVEGNLSATVLDMAYWKSIYGWSRRNALPGVHVSVRGGVVYVKEQVDYRLELFRDMMRSVSRIVQLPDAEFVAHLWDHPKVPRQQPLPIFAHYADEAHRDIPMPAPWSWDTARHAFPQPFTKLPHGCPLNYDQRRAQLYFRGGCNGPTRGWRGPLWRFYPRKRANRISKQMPDKVDAGVYDHCDSAKLSKMEHGWDAQMEKEMWEEGPKKKIESFAANCGFKYLLHIDGNVASSRMASELHVGSTVFKQRSFSSEYFYPLLKPWVHYVPVASNLEDVPAKLKWANENPQMAHSIAAAGQAFAKAHLHETAVACYWWHLLSALGELQNFVPRTKGFHPI